jgi:putative endopeptidase
MLRFLLHKKGFSMTKVLVFSLLFSLLTSAAEVTPAPATTTPAPLTKAPTSEIPAKREFPLSSTLKPCDDFHKYVCSEAENSFKLREDRSAHTFAFDDSRERILDAKKKFFAHIKMEKGLNERDEQVKDYYQACMDAKDGVLQEKMALQTLKDLTKNSKSMAEFYHLNVDSLWKGQSTVFEFGTDSNKDNPKIYDIYIASNLMNLPQYTYYDNKELMAEYRNIAIAFFKIAEPKAKPAAIQKRVDNMIQLEKDFVAIYPHPEVMRQRWSEKRQETQSDFKKKYSHLPLQEILQKTPENLFVTNPIPESLAFLNDHADDKYLETFKDLYVFSMGFRMLDDSQPKFYKKVFAFNNKFLGGPNSRPDRNERCTRSVERAFDRELDQLLLPRLFPNFPEGKVREVAAKIKESINDGLKKNTWLTSASRAKAMLKIKTAKLYLVKPQNDKEWDLLPVRKYSSTKRIDNAYLHKVTEIDKDLDDAKHEVNQEAWGMGPLTVNAYYDPSANKFVLPIGILQYPFFVSDGDLIENLGAVGVVLGHELGHGIDDQGAKFDETGKLAEWMTLKEIGEFRTRGERLVTYFNKAGHNGSLTLGENIADLVGVSFAYNAAFPDGKGTPEDKRRFFIAYARLWCYKARPKAEENQLKTNPHSLGWARINEQVKHQPGFIEVFQCKKGDAMFLAPGDQVKIW